MKIEPSTAVVSNQTWFERSSPRWMADNASTIVSELMSSTNELAEVNGMSNTSFGPMEPSAMRFLYSR
ncbi:unannotated protein [freshwater metagenome]|uniref:Unannotated protein n=1 Tax=freshwater metagenome TaxID=449393 RepID=A0A6J6ZC34_9ZZZZ